MRTLSGIVASLALGVASTSADTVALYDFSEGTATAPITTVVNRGTLGEAANGAAACGEGASVLYSDDLPGAHLYPSYFATEPLATAWKSAEFTMADSQGGYITIPGLGEKIATYGVNGAFTAEFFVKVAPETGNWKVFLQFFYRSETANSQQAKYVIWFGDRFGLQMSSANPDSISKVERDRWYHLAVVYSKSNEEEGVWKMYCDGVLFATQRGTIVGSADNGNLYLGGRGNSDANMVGKIAGVRISNTALAPQQFLKAASVDAARKQELDGALGFWSFSEGTVGAVVNRSANAVDADDGLVGSAQGTNGTLPVYSDDVPGKYLIASSTSGKVIATNVKSVKVSGNSDNSGGGRLELLDLARRIRWSGAGTLEFFGKIDAFYTWRNFFGMSNTSTNSFKIASRNVEKDICIQYYRPTAQEHTTSVSPSAYDWHHFAFAWDNVTRRLDFYVDYRLIWSEEDTDFGETIQSGYFGANQGGVAGNLLDGKIAGIRLMPRRLAPTEMMVASNVDDPSAYDAATLFHWSFEEPTAVAGAKMTRVESAPSNLVTFNGVASYSNSQLPTYATEVFLPAKDSTVQGAGSERVVLSANRFCARLYGYSEAYPNTWSGSQLEQHSVIDGVEIRPESFTVEMFLRRASAEFAARNSQLIAGFAATGIDVKRDDSDWYLSLKTAQSHQLEFNYRKSDGTSGFVDTGIQFEDGAWHHFAMTYDASTQKALFYVDYVQVYEHEVPGGLQLTTDRSWRHVFGRGINQAGFNGWMDDIRVSSTARPVSEFLRKGNGQRGLILIFR